MFSHDAIAHADWHGSQPRQDSHSHLISTPNNTPIVTAAEYHRDSNPVHHPHAYAIGAGPGSISSASPGSTAHDAGYDNLPGSPGTFTSQPQHQSGLYARQQQAANGAQQLHHPRQRSTMGPLPPEALNQNPSANSRKRKRDPSTIYDTVQKPYSYTTGFHALTELLTKRFPSEKRFRVAKSLGSVRPTYIASLKDLSDTDLLYMEKYLQRTLSEYGNIISLAGTPTIVVRRTGEVAVANKEFCILTGWREDVLLGHSPNLNVNTGSSGNPAGSGANTGSSTRGAVNTPRIPPRELEKDPERKQPVFIAELMDEDSVVGFYEDYARLAFGDPRGFALKPCKLLKYRTKEDTGPRNFDHLPDDGSDHERGGRGDNGHSRRASTREVVKKERTSHPVKTESGATISNEADIHALGREEGMVECMYCWTVKRDYLEVPMLMCINVSLRRVSRRA